MHPLGGNKSTYQTGVADKLAREPEEGLLKVVVGLGRDVVVLEVLFPVEGDGLGLHLALLDIDLVAAENDGDVLADARKVTCRAVSNAVHPSRSPGVAVYVRCQLGTFLYVIRDVTSNMMMPHWPLM